MFHITEKFKEELIALLPEPREPIVPAERDEIRNPFPEYLKFQPDKQGLPECWQGLWLVSDFEWWYGGDPGKVLLGFNDQALAIAPFAMQWISQWSLAIKFANAKVVFELDAVDQFESELRRIRKLISAAIARREKTFRTCEMCGELTPPEWRHGDTICVGCAERYLGIIY